MASTAPSTRRPKPTLRERAAERVCPECSAPVARRSPRGRMPTFCGEACKRAHGNRHTVEGRALAALLKAWRVDRGSGEIAQKAFQQVCQIVDLFNARDAEHVGPNGERRQRADLYAAKMLADGSMFIDRERRR